MSNKFCRLLSNGYKINVQGERLLWSPCCYYTRKTDLLDSAQLKKEIEYTSNANEWLPECNVCFRMEFGGIKMLSPRQLSFQRVPDDVENGVCIDLEVSFDTRCNAACMPCDDSFSSTWAKFNYKYKISQSKPQDVNVADTHLQQLIDTVPLDRVRNVFILGGEPFFSDTHVKLLQHIRLVHTNLNEVRLCYLTNGSIFPDPSIRELWKDFGEVVITFSLDGIGERFEYLRWPLKWEVVSNVVKCFVSETNVKMAVNCTVNPLNILYAKELQDWMTATIPDHRLILPTVRPNRAFGTMDLSNTPFSYRNDIKLLYGEDHPMYRVFTGAGISKEIPRMIEYLDKIDNIRGNNWRQVFPDAMKYLEP